MSREDSRKKRKKIKKDQLLEEILKIEKKCPTKKELEESFDYLRVSVKYLLLDLEATRRERDVLMKEIKRLKGL